MEMKKTEVKMNKLIYLGQAVLDLSKTLIHKDIFACLFSFHNTISMFKWATFREILLPSSGPMIGEVSLET